MIFEVAQIIKSDKKYYSDRTILHHNYELIEGFWRSKYGNHDEAFNLFVKEFGDEFWNITDIKKMATQFASIECVGSNRHGGFVQTEEIAKATMYLRYFSSLFKKNIPKCNEINCREYKQEQKLCTKLNGRKWTKKNHAYSSFKAIMFIIRQVRNNLFHGSKFSMAPNQYKRDKKVVALSARTTEIIIDRLPKILQKSYR